MIERCVRDAGGTYLCCDTDALTIVATKAGGTVEMPDGAAPVKVLSWSEVEQIRCLTGAVVIVEFEFVVEMNLVQIGTNEFFPQLSRLAANERHLQSRPYSNQKLGRRDQSAASSELFPSFTRRSFPTGTRDGGSREPCEPQPCSLGERNVYPEPSAIFLPPQGHDRQSFARECKVVARAVLGGLHHEYRWERIAA